MMRFEGPPPVLVPNPLKVAPPPLAAAPFAQRLVRVWRRWLARRAGPLVWCRELSNNPTDFFSSDPVEEIPLREFVSFVEHGKGYVMDIRSATALLAKDKDPTNPFTREPLSLLFLRRIRRHGTVTGWGGLEAQTPELKLLLDTTDLFTVLQELGYYTDPAWFTELQAIQLQRLYIELADLWFHRATLTAVDRERIVPGKSPFTMPVKTVLCMRERALRPLLLQTCRTLVSSAAARGDRQLGAMYILGSLALISRVAATGYPWLVEQFGTGATRMSPSGRLLVHPGALLY